MQRLFGKGDHIADGQKAQEGILNAGTVSSRADTGYWIACPSGGSTVIKSENAILAQEALNILEKSN